MQRNVRNMAMPLVQSPLEPRDVHKHRGRGTERIEVERDAYPRALEGGVVCFDHQV